MTTKSVFVSALGVLTGFFTNLVAGLKKDGLEDEQIHDLFVGKKSEEFIEKIRIVAKEMARPMFPVWKTITVGTHQSAEAWIKALTGAGFRVSDWAKDILNRIKKFQAQSQVSFGRATLAELGFTKSATISEIISRIKELGYEPCNPDDAPALRLAYKDQPLGEWVWVAMEPIRDSDGDLKIFLLDHDDDGLWLHSYDANPGFTWNPSDVFVFRLSCK